jgi:hypothetical protein
MRSPVLDTLIRQLNRISSEIEIVEQEESRRKVRTYEPLYPWLDLSGFDLANLATRSQLLREQITPPRIPAGDRFLYLVKDLIVDIRAAKVWLQHDVYPKRNASPERVSRLEEAFERLQELSRGVNISDPYYLDQRFLKDTGEEYCWDCASSFITRTRSSLIYACMLLSRQHYKLADTLWRLCQWGYWWSSSYYTIKPHRFSLEIADGRRVCDRCSAPLFYSLNAYGVEEEADIFLEREGEMDLTAWWQLWTVFDGAQEMCYPNFIADKLDLLIKKYQLDSSSRRTVTETNYE